MSESYAASFNRFAIFAMGGKKGPARWRTSGAGDSQPTSVARPASARIKACPYDGGKNGLARQKEPRSRGNADCDFQPSDRVDRPKWP
jgi:hypothetical protein